MPEGDTIHRAARALDAALAGRTVTRFEAPRLRARPVADGTLVEGVEARGKHCLIRFGDGRTLHTHMGMTGSWHLYRPGERWRKRPAAARVVLEVSASSNSGPWIAVCFAPPVVELVAEGRGRSLRASRWGAGVADHLGPDLVRADADLDAAVARFETAVPRDTEVGVAMLDQRVACGVGNVYKSEVCFACGLDPFTPVSQVPRDLRHRLVATAQRQLRSNLDTVERSTVDGGGLAVYRRDGRPCRRCGTVIQRRLQGEQARSTYWCPTCQVRP